MQNKYDEDQLKIWQRGGLGPIILQPLTLSQAIALRSKLYRLRKRLEKDNDPTYQVARLATIKLYEHRNKDGTGHQCLMVHPTNMEFEQAFIQAGIKEPSDEPPPLE